MPRNVQDSKSVLMKYLSSVSSILLGNVDESTYALKPRYSAVPSFSTERKSAGFDLRRDPDKRR